MVRAFRGMKGPGETWLSQDKDLVSIGTSFLLCARHKERNTSQLVSLVPGIQNHSIHVK